MNGLEEVDCSNESHNIVKATKSRRRIPARREGYQVTLRSGRTGISDALNEVVELFKYRSILPASQI